MYRREQIVDSLLRNVPDVECFMTIFGKCVGIEGDQGILGSMLFERIVEREEARQVLGIGDQGSPHLVVASQCCQSRFGNGTKYLV